MLTRLFEHKLIEMFFFLRFLHLHYKVQYFHIVCRIIKTAYQNLVGTCICLDNVRICVVTKHLFHKISFLVRGTS